MVRVILVGEVPRRVLSALVGGYDVRLMAQITPEDVGGWGKATLGNAPYHAVVVGRGVPGRLKGGIEQVARQREASLVQYTTGMDAQSIADDVGAYAVKPIPAFVVSFNNKGGTGKSTLVANAAVRMAHGGQRVLLVDDDVQNGDVASYLGLDNNAVPHIGELLEYRDGALEPQHIQQAITASEYGVDVLAAPPTPTGTSLTVPQAWEFALALADLPYDVIFVDSPPGLTAETLTRALLQQSLVQVAMLPFTDDQAGLKGLREARTLILEQVPQHGIVPVLMRIRPDALAEPGQIAELEGLEVTEIPYFAELARQPVLAPNGHGGFKTFLGAFLGRVRAETDVAFESLGQRLAQVLAAAEN
jgi:cellulose biosynthesis protein BcsQ